MNKKVSVKQIQELDTYAIKHIGIPSLVLMENAGRHVAIEVLKTISKKEYPSVCVFCGLGNNAGDGFVVARHLLNAGIPTKIFLLGKENKLKVDAAVNCQILRKCGYKVKEIKKITPSIDREIVKADIVVDAIFGVGLSREIRGFYQQAIQAINKANKYVISVDIPSGLDGTTGDILGCCIKAKKTVTFTFAKLGCFLNDGPQQTGRLIVSDIGIPERLKKKI